MEDGKLQEAIEAGLSSAMFVDLLISLCSELKRLNKMQETVARPAGVCECVCVCVCMCVCVRVCVHAWLHVYVLCATGEEDAESFQLEMRGFLQELSCPHPQLTSSINPLTSYSSRLLLVGQFKPHQLSFNACIKWCTVITVSTDFMQ